MARGRILDRDISYSGRFHSVSASARLLWLMALPQTDKAGRISGECEELKARVMPLADITSEQIECAALELIAAGLWGRYRDDRGRQVAVFERFYDYQEESRLKGEKASKWSEPTPDSWESAPVRTNSAESERTRTNSNEFAPQGKIREENTNEGTQAPTRVRKSKDGAGLPPEFDGCRWAPDEIEHAFAKSYAEHMKRPLRMNRKDREEYLLKPCPELQPVDDLEDFFGDAIRALSEKGLAVTLRSCINAISWVALRTDDETQDPASQHPMFRKAVSPFAPKAD